MRQDSRRRIPPRRADGTRDDRPQPDGVWLDAAARVRLGVRSPGGGPGALYRAAARRIGGGR